MVNQITAVHEGISARAVQSKCEKIQFTGWKFSLAIFPDDATSAFVCSKEYEPGVKGEKINHLLWDHTQLHGVSVQARQVVEGFVLA